MKLNGSEILVECLLEQNVDSVFGYPGGAVLNIYDALYKYRDKIKHYLTSHEQGASHAADGYARATGKVGVCIATSGPGATNLVTGIATAYMDSIPMIAITGNVAQSLLGKDSFQEVDICGIVMPITKHSFIVKDVNELAPIIRKAFKIAATGRPGPVLIDITKDVTSDIAEYSKEEPLEIERVVEHIKESDLEEVLGILDSCERPLIYAGGGVIAAEASKELLEFAEKTNSPVCCSLMGIGAIPSSDKHYTGMVGMHGTKTSNLAVSECDVLIAIGSRFSDRVVSDIDKFAKNAQIVQIDVDPAEIDKNIITSYSVVGDIKSVLSKLNERIKKKNNEEWFSRIEELKAKFPLNYEDDKTLRPKDIFDAINQLTKGEAVITTEVGQHQMWAAQLINTEKPRHFLTSAGLGTMGYGLGASIGAAVAKPDKVVINIAGDGCFRMNNIELATAVEYDLPIIVIILNNHALGMVRQWQTLFYDKRYSNTTLSNTTDFVALAKAYKAESFNVTEKDEILPTLEKAIALRKTVVINCEICSDNKVLPMVPPGAGIYELVTE